LRKTSAGIITASASSSTVAMAGKEFWLRTAFAVRIQDYPNPNRYKVISRPVSPIF